MSNSNIRIFGDGHGVPIGVRNALARGEVPAAGKPRGMIEGAAGIVYVSRAIAAADAQHLTRAVTSQLMEGDPRG